MKTMVIVAFLVVVASGADAQWAPIENYLTILPDPYSTAYDFNCEYQEENGIVTYTLYLHDPVNPQFMDQGARAVANVGGFECRIETTEGVNILDWSFPVPSIDIGQDGNHIVGFSEPVPGDQRPGGHWPPSRSCSAPRPSRFPNCRIPAASTTRTPGST